MTASEPWRSLARTLLGDPELTGPEVATQAGIDFEQAGRLWRALGFPPVPDDERVFTHPDVEVLRRIRGLLEEEGADQGVLLQLTRVTGQSLARVAEAQVASSTDLTVLMQADVADEIKADLIASRFRALLPQLEPLLGYVWRRHLLAALLRVVATPASQVKEGRTLVVGFVDLVGFTAVSQQLTEQELAAMVDRFEQVAYEHIPQRGGRVVKMIGDEVMFSVADAGAAAEIALGFVEAHGDGGVLPEMRVGLAVGPTLSWEGDLFGPTVNLASRLVNLARPGTVLISEELGRALRDRASITLRHLRPLPIKGIGRVRVWVLRPAKESVNAPGSSPRRRRDRTRRPGEAHDERE